MTADISLDNSLKSVVLKALCIFVAFSFTSCSKDKKDSKLVVAVQSDNADIVTGPAKTCGLLVYGASDSGQNITEDDYYAPFGRVDLNWTHDKKYFMLASIKLKFPNIDGSPGDFSCAPLVGDELDALFASVTNSPLIEPGIPPGIRIRSKDFAYGTKTCPLLCRNIPIDEDTESFTIQGTLTVRGLAQDKDGADPEIVVSTKTVKISYEKE